MISRDEDFFYPGKIIKLHGTKGRLIVALDVDDPGYYAGLTSVFLDIEHEKVPFFLDIAEIRENKTVVVKFRNTETPEHAQAFIGRQLYLPISQLPKLSGNKFYYHEIKGFSVIDHHYGMIGHVFDIIELPHQPLLRVKDDTREILIPLVDEVIRKVDKKARKIFIQAPEGLIDIYR